MEDLLARRPTVVMEPDQGHLFHLNMLESAAEQAVQTSMPPEKRQRQRELMLGKIRETFHRSLKGYPLAKVAPKKDPDKILRDVNQIRPSLPEPPLGVGPLRCTSFQAGSPTPSAT